MVDTCRFFFFARDFLVVLGTYWPSSAITSGDEKSWKFARTWYVPDDRIMLIDLHP